MRILAGCLFSLWAGAAGAAGGPQTAASGVTGCAERLERTLAAMQARPLLKEEHATALMWLRMDAAEAAAAGDQAGCVTKIVVIENLLGMVPREHWN